MKFRLFAATGCALLMLTASLTPVELHAQTDSKPSEKPTSQSTGSNDAAGYNPAPFDKEFPNLDSQAVGEWWKKSPGGNARNKVIDMNVPRDEVVAFAIYTHHNGVLKMTAQLFPLKPDEARVVRLEFAEATENSDKVTWKEVAKAEVLYPGWDAHFRIEDWDNTKNVRYRVRHGAKAAFSGLIRKDPVDKSEIVVASMSCNSSRTKGPREQIIDNIKAQDPDLMFFAGDQTYHHTQHTAGWLEWGMQFREVIGDRPTITIPDDHDVGQANLWGENGKKAKTAAGPMGGYFYPPAYVNMVQRQQTSHLPDAADPTPIERDITVYYTNLLLGGIDFAILEDRKFKSGPEGKIPKMGPRPDHINDSAYDRSSVDVEGLKLLGDRQLGFLADWTTDWTGADYKCALSQTAFCGAVHLHGSESNRLLADLDCNGWPQTGRNNALRLIRQAWAPHICGDQHLAVVVKHGIDAQGDGPYAFTSPAIVNTIYGRWWHPEDEQAGANPIPNSPLPWTGEFLDGLGNPILMIAYANPPDVKDEKQRADGHGIVRFNKTAGTLTFECWPRFAKVSDGDSAQFPGWPITVNMTDNDGREVIGRLPAVNLDGVERPVVQVINEATEEVLYTVRAPESGFEPPVFATGSYTMKLGKNTPSEKTLKGIKIQ